MHNVPAGKQGRVTAIDSCYSLGYHKSQSLFLGLPGRENGIGREDITGAKVRANMRGKCWRKG